MDHIIAHEHFHGIQYAYTHWKWGNQADWYIEGTARFIETIMDAADSYNPNSLFYFPMDLAQFYRNGVNYYMLHPDEQLISRSYDFALFWGYLYAHDGEFNTIEQIFEEIRNAGNNPETDGPNVISRVLAKVPGEHDSFEELIKDFHIAVYTKNLTWNGYNWGDHLVDVRTTSTSFTGQPTSYSDSVNKWAADYIKINPQADTLYFENDQNFWMTSIRKAGTGSVIRSASLEVANESSQETYRKIISEAGLNISNYSFEQMRASTIASNTVITPNNTITDADAYDDIVIVVSPLDREGSYTLTLDEVQKKQNSLQQGESALYVIPKEGNQKELKNY